MLPFETPLRRAAQDLILNVPGAFLRVDRGDALYVSDVLRRGAQPERTIAAFDRIEYNAEAREGLLFLSPRVSWMPRVTDAIYKPEWEDEQSRLLSRLLSRDTGAFEYQLWIGALKWAEGMGRRDILERRIREAAAVCLRKKRGGGSLFHSYILYKSR